MAFAALLLLAPPSTARGTAAPAAARPPLITGETAYRQIHFTFDDGPDPRTTPRLLEILDRVGVKVTFFFSTNRFVARQARNVGSSALAREIVRRGHTAGSHSFEHERMARMSSEQARVQLDRGEHAFRKALGVPPRWFRPPFGSHGPAVDRLLAERGYTLVMWNLGMADWVARPPERIHDTFWRKIAENEREGVRGGIVLLHDTHTWSIDAFERIVASLAKRNCELLSRDEEPYDIVDSLEPFVTPLEEAAHVARVAEVRARAARWCEENRGAP